MKYMPEIEFHRLSMKEYQKLSIIITIVSVNIVGYHFKATFTGMATFS